MAASEEAKKKVKQKRQEADQDNSKLVKKLTKLQKDRENVMRSGLLMLISSWQGRWIRMYIRVGVLI